MKTLIFSVLGLTFMTVVVAVPPGKIECLADLKGPTDDPNNLYNCLTSQKCCQEGGKPTCCSTMPSSVATTQQLQLWGTLAALILILGLIMWYFRHDGDCCGNKKGQQSRVCCCCAKKEPLEDKSKIIPASVGTAKSPPGDLPPSYSDIDYERA